MGHLEMTVMEVLWEHGAGSVHEVLSRLERPLAYNTVMTTLDRLFKKGLLSRKKQARSFIYAPHISRQAWQRRQASSLFADLLASSATPSDLFVSCLVEAVGQHDAAMLSELEERIRRKREELDRGRKS